MKLNEKIKNLRIENNLTQQEFADKLFVSRSAVAKWEQNRGMPSLELLNKIAEIFGVKIEDLLDDNIEDEPQKQKPKKTWKHKLVIFFVVLAILALGSLVLPLLVMDIINCRNSSPPPKGPYAIEYTHTGDILFYDDMILVYTPNKLGSDMRFKQEDCKNAYIFNAEGKEIEFEQLKDGYKIKVYYTKHGVYGQTAYTIEVNKIQLLTVVILE